MSDRDILKSTLAATPECLTLAQLETLLDGKQSHPHLAGCPRCQAELAMLKSFQSSAPLPDEGAAVAWISSHLDRQLESIKNPVRSRARATVQSLGQQSWLSRVFGQGGFSWALPMTAAAAVVIVGALLWQPPKAPELEANSGGKPVIYRSQEVAVFGPLGELQQVPQQLHWQAFSGAVTYKVAVMEVDQTRLWAADTRETSVAIPASIRAKMLPGKPILWQVTALDGQGRVLSTSQIQRFSAPREHSSEKDQPSR
jgi:hypothetical protein